VIFRSAVDQCVAASNTLRWLWTHPLASKDRKRTLARWARWQAASRIWTTPAVVPFVDSAVLVVERGMEGATGNVYAGLHEFADMAFLLHFLRDTDFFVDVGANIGSYTVLAAGVRGAETISVEPIPRSFARLMANLRINGIQNRVDACNVGLAAQAGRLRFTSTQDSVNHVISSGEAEEPNTVELPVTTLDELVGERAPLLIKIDVEGFETEVLQGAGATLANPGLRAIIIELADSGRRYGHDEGAIRRKLEMHGFATYGYEPLARKLDRGEGPPGGNALYLRDATFVAERLASAPSFRAIGVDV
jgi:FkbM family methyltransferase